MALSLLERKERIVLTTIDVMNEYGIHSVSTREIAIREGITEAAIFKHFPKKKDLYLAVLEYFSKYDNDIYESILLKQLSPRDAIMYYEDLYTTYYENYPAITVITQALDEMRYNLELTEKVQEIINRRIQFLKEFILKAQINEDISKELDADILVDIFMGTINAICLNWRITDYSFSLKEKSNQAIIILLNAFKEK